ncbi:MAG: acyl-CoA thioesterase [Deltaproteobacteria bacterium]|nr:acyl-CoA thioesterase [Deltaproteobacteria bacterium]
MNRSSFSFCFPLRVRYSEVDAQGFVFNANHIVYFQTALQEYFRGLDYDFATQSSGSDFHTVKIVAEYQAPIRFDEEVEIFVRPARLGRSSIRWEMMSCLAGSDQICSSGEIIWVNADRETHKSVPIPEELVEIFRAREGDKLES